jgi:monoterpene epsilon-lactone hydrolase
MQSWQTDLLNLQLSLSVKPMFKYVGSIERIRQLVDLSDGLMGRLAVPRGTQRSPAAIPGAEFDAEWIEVEGTEPERVILYLPGGAYIIRMPNIHTAMVSKLCRNANARALMAYYRLAPEHPFPACLEDALLAYQWLLGRGIEPANIAIAGDSAGGGLTLSTLLAIKQRQLPMPGCAYMLSPLLDVSDQAPSRWKNAISDAALPAPKKRAINPRPLYLGDNAADDPMVSPINGDLTGLPPLYIQVSDSEMLLDDSLRLARRGHTYDVEVTVDIWRKVPHVWQIFGFLPEAGEALEKSARFLREHTR